MKDFSEIYREYYPKLLRFAGDIVTCREDAENLLHDAFLDLWKINDRLHTINNINAYLCRLVRNRCYDFLKHKVHEKAYETETLAEARCGIETLEAMSDEQFMACELTQLVRNAVDNLPPRCREIFTLSRVNGLRHSEIAERLGLSENTVSVQLGIALRRLRALTDKYMNFQ